MKIALNSKTWAGLPITISGRPGSSLEGKTRSVPDWGVVSAVAGGLVVNDNETISLIMGAEEAARPISINGLGAIVDPALYADGPVCLVPPVIRRVTIGGKQNMELVSGGIWSSDVALGGVHNWGTGWYRNGLTYYRATARYEKTTYDSTSHVFTYREYRTQGDKVRFQDSNPVQFV